MVLPSDGTYQVKVRVNDASLEECSIIKSGDSIQPYFASPVGSDPDISGLMVYLQNVKGEVPGGKTLYTLNSVSDTVDSKNKKDTRKPDTIVQVKRLDKDLPVFFLPEDMEIGQYTLVFQVLGGKEHLSQSEELFYYLDKAEFSLKKVQMYLPGKSTSRLIPPGTTIMLEARLDFDPQLDPYVVWYNGKKVISEGRISSGAGATLWEVPEQNGFHSVRVEAFPFPVRQGLRGNSQIISLPVSSKAANLSVIPEDSPALLHWYKFEGSLMDSKPPASAEWALIPKEEKLPRWNSAGYSYGLSVGGNEAYLLPPVSFFHEKDMQQGGGQFLFRFRPVSNGIVFSARFGSAVINVRITDEHLMIILNVPGILPRELALPLVFPENDDYITAGIDFYIQPDLFTVTLQSRGELSAVQMSVSVSDKCDLVFGVSDNPEEPAAIVVWDEFAILFSDKAIDKITTEGTISIDPQASSVQDVSNNEQLAGSPSAA